MSEYTGTRAVAAEGARIGFVVCKRCGVAICLDPQDSFDACSLHDEWHAKQTLSIHINDGSAERRAFRDEDIRPGNDAPDE